LANQSLRKHDCAFRISTCAIGHHLKIWPRNGFDRAVDCIDWHHVFYCIGVKRYLTILASALLGGCAINPPQQASSDPGLGPHQYEASTASALAFDAPVAAAYPLLGLDRDAREPGVFIGYQDTTTEFFSISMFDDQSNDPACDTYDRFSYTQKVGTRVR
jgi:hypothetical protein